MRRKKGIKKGRMKIEKRKRNKQIKKKRREIKYKKKFLKEQTTKTIKTRHWNFLIVFIAFSL